MQAGTSASITIQYVRQKLFLKCQQIYNIQVEKSKMNRHFGTKLMLHHFRLSNKSTNQRKHLVFIWAMAEEATKIYPFETKVHIFRFNEMLIKINFPCPFYPACQNYIFPLQRVILGSKNKTELQPFFRVQQAQTQLGYTHVLMLDVQEVREKQARMVTSQLTMIIN